MKTKCFVTANRRTAALHHHALIPVDVHCSHFVPMGPSTMGWMPTKSSQLISGQALS